MKINYHSKNHPDIVLEIYNPPGHRRLLIQMVGKLPQDGIPYAVIPELKQLFSEIAGVVEWSSLAPYDSKAERAIMTAAQALHASPTAFRPFMVGNDMVAVLREIERCINCQSVVLNIGDHRQSTQIKRQSARVKDVVLCEECAVNYHPKYKCVHCSCEFILEEMQRINRNMYLPTISTYDFFYICDVCFGRMSAFELLEYQEGGYANS